jgi:hypothetical protein
MHLKQVRCKDVDLIHLIQDRTACRVKEGYFCLLCMYVCMYVCNPVTVYPIMLDNPGRNMKQEKWNSQLSICFKGHMAFRKADESLVCSDKT